jgi:mannose/fructose/N-acetylgalactosamine-specific phosphotransferase system component IIC
VFGILLPIAIAVIIIVLCVIYKKKQKAYSERNKQNDYTKPIQATFLGPPTVIPMNN